MWCFIISTTDSRRLDIVVILSLGSMQRTFMKRWTRRAGPWIDIPPVDVPCLEVIKDVKY